MPSNPDMTPKIHGGMTIACAACGNVHALKRLVPISPPNCPRCGAAIEIEVHVLGDLTSWSNIAKRDVLRMDGPMPDAFDRD